MKTTFVLGIIFCFNLCFAQDNSDKSNPIVFGDFNFSFATGNTDGLLLGASFNWQKKHHLATVRYNHIWEFEFDVVHPLIPVPIEERSTRLNELSLLYGYRKINSGFSFHFSAGPSYNYFIDRFNSDNIDQSFNERFFGVSYEIGFKFYKKRKKGLYPTFYIPVQITSDTGFSRSIGLKLIGSVSRRSYVALALSYGIGFHKKY